jgi:hypothetical protein
MERLLADGHWLLLRGAQLNLTMISTHQVSTVIVGVARMQHFGMESIRHQLLARPISRTAPHKLLRRAVTGMWEIHASARQSRGQLLQGLNPHLRKASLRLHLR